MTDRSRACLRLAMNTHSVDLGMNLAGLARLTTDTGITLQASKQGLKEILLFYP